jgi:hypothetical protein
MAAVAVRTSLQLMWLVRILASSEKSVFLGGIRRKHTLWSQMQLGEMFANLPIFCKNLNLAVYLGTKAAVFYY